MSTSEVGWLVTGLRRLPARCGQRRLNDGVKGFLPGDAPSARRVYESDSLRVAVASPEYLLAMQLFGPCCAE